MRLLSAVSGSCGSIAIGTRLPVTYSLSLSLSLLNSPRWIRPVNRSHSLHRLLSLEFPFSPPLSLDAHQPLDSHTGQNAPSTTCWLFRRFLSSVFVRSALVQCVHQIHHQKTFFILKNLVPLSQKKVSLSWIVLLIETLSARCSLRGNDRQSRLAWPNNQQRCTGSEFERICLNKKKSKN